ncbi:hypothetical protein MML48_4g00006126 [Holotrichia oblita]|uniref:Uncharacterized protein n=1 Tax=Holotrichia oblita TaxID=644536 RepID=A0ACB9T7N7_HOLOL|nr:hypothetical protein MML48_4g00006126 [Holotrichia oblita]
MKYIQLLISFIFLTVIAVNESFCQEGILDKLTSGFKLAGRLLGLDRVVGVSQLVTETFGGNVQRDTKQNNGGNNIFSSFLRIFGFDVKKIGAITVNAIIFVAQLISTSLGKTAPPPSLSDERAREIKDGDPFEWLSNNTQMSDVIRYVQDKNLSEHIIEYIKEHSLDEETDCIQLLICKLSPFIDSMQKSLQPKGENEDSGKNVLFKHMPSIENITTIGDKCEENHPYCRLIY